MTLCEPAGYRAYRLASVLKRLARLPRSFFLTCAECRMPLSSGPRFVYLGEGESLPYLKKLFGGGRFELLQGKIPCWRLGKTIRDFSESGALLCVEINRLIPSVISGKGFLAYPWIRQRVYIDSLDYRNRKRKIEDNFGRKVRKYQYQFRLAHSAEQVEHFYRKLYIPHVTTRFKMDCHARSLVELQKVAQKGFLVQVLRGDLWIAGAVCSVQKNRLSAWAFGHLPGNEYPLRFGALSAAYYYLFQYAENNSLNCVDLMRSRPHSNDGVFCHKQRWGAAAERDSWPHTSLRLICPKEIPIPEFLKKLLIWNGRRFVEMEESRSSCTR